MKQEKPKIGSSQKGAQGERIHQMGERKGKQGVRKTERKKKKIIKVKPK